MKKRGKKDIYSLVLKVLMSISAIFYLIIFIQEIIPPYTESLIGISIIPYVFCIFLAGYYFTLKNDFFASGLLVMVWYFVLWICSLWIWINAGTTLVLGAPVFVFGVLMLIKGILKKRKSNKLKSKK
jgi:predicted membrane protein